MICPRCSMAELAADTQQCVKCGYSPAGAVAVATVERDPVDEAARHELRELFEIEALHRRGPASIVYIARDREVDQRVAVKVMPRSPEAGAAADNGFHQAAAAAAGLDHAHVVPMYSAGTSDHLFWYSIGYIEGPSLAEVLAEKGPMELPLCLRLVQQIGSALDHAHRRGVIHADLKPANVLLDGAGWARVTDFLVPRALEQLGALGAAGGSSRRPEYVAPEERLTRHPGPHVDQYALALLVYESLSGSLPFAGDAVEASAERPPLLCDVDPRIPRHVALAVERGLSAAPGGRFATVLDFVAELQAPAALVRSRSAPTLPPQRAPVLLRPDADPGGRPRARRRRWIPVGALALAVVAVAVSVSVQGSGRATQATIAARREARPAGTPHEIALRPDSAAVRRSDASATPTEPRAPAAAAIAAAPRRPGGAQPGYLFINATPWGEVYVDDALIGNTPKAGIPVSPGTHRVSVLRDGFAPFERTIHVGSGQQLRLTDIVLRELKP